MIDFGFFESFARDESLKTSENRNIHLQLMILYNVNIYRVMFCLEIVYFSEMSMTGDKKDKLFQRVHNTYK